MIDSKYTIKAKPDLSDISKVLEVDDILRMWEDILNDQFLRLFSYPRHSFSNGDHK